MKRYIVGLILVTAATLWPIPAQAHVLLADTKANIGAVLHINPDDDPVAGQTNQLYFDLQDKNSQVRIAYSGYELLVMDEQGKGAKPVLEIADSTLIASYNFPRQGLYKLTLRSKSSYEQFQKVSMTYSLRVSRGTANPAETKEEYPLATVTAMGAGIALTVLTILAYNNRRLIARHSTF